MKAEREDLEVFETAYNTACISIARGELGQAEVLLKRARGTSQDFHLRHALGLTDIQIFAMLLMSWRPSKRKRSCFPSSFSSSTS